MTRSFYNTFMHCCFFIIIPIVALFFLYSEFIWLWMLIGIVAAIYLHLQPYITYHNNKAFFAISPFATKVNTEDLDSEYLKKLAKSSQFKTFESNNDLIDCLAATYIHKKK